MFVKNIEPIDLAKKNVGAYGTRLKGWSGLLLLPVVCDQAGFNCYVSFEFG